LLTISVELKILGIALADCGSVSVINDSRMAAGTVLVLLAIFFTVQHALGWGVQSL
jgi:hypothetical protein